MGLVTLRRHRGRSTAGIPTVIDPWMTMRAGAGSAPVRDPLLQRVDGGLIDATP
jgi:hypothetical protein